MAKGVVGLAPVAQDGSAYFEVPAGKTIFFQVLDGQLNEIQRMRSVLQLQEGETRGCIGCHESRSLTSRPASAMTFRQPPAKLVPPPWGAGPFDYAKTVQPVLNARCLSCHEGGGKNKIDLSGAMDKDPIPASYRSLIKGGWVNHFNMNWHQKHFKAEPLTFGTTQSQLFRVLKDENHGTVKLSPDERHAITCWIDLNCPLWPDYLHRSKRPGCPPIPSASPLKDTAKDRTAAR